MALDSFEKSCLNDFRKGWTPEHSTLADDASLLRFGLWTLFIVGKMIRSASICPAKVKRTYKEDGSPVTPLEHQIEVFVKESIQRYLPAISFVGEELGGKLQSKGVSIVLDPIDGTWSFLSHSGTSATSIAFFRDGCPFIGMVMNSSSGEIGYVLKGRNSRLIQLNLFGEDDHAVNLPTSKKADSTKILVNFHPSRESDQLAQALFEAWQEGSIRLVKSTSGSPALALLEASKGHCCYINLWKGRSAVSYDLAAGILLVRGAGGNVLDRHGETISFSGHYGPLIACASSQSYSILIESIRKGLFDSSD
jgi:fructose-1,6-bisphosphatase/inositol monophosphatase family enzyme